MCTSPCIQCRFGFGTGTQASVDIEGREGHSRPCRTSRDSAQSAMGLSLAASPAFSTSSSLGKTSSFTIHWTTDALARACDRKRQSEIYRRYAAYLFFFSLPPAHTSSSPRYF